LRVGGALQSRFSAGTSQFTRVFSVPVYLDLHIFSDQDDGDYSHKMYLFGYNYTVYTKKEHLNKWQEAPAAKKIRFQFENAY